MQGIEFVNESDALKVDDTGLKNKWRFALLNERDAQGNTVGTWFRKLKEVGCFFCIVCSATLKYGNNGKKALFKHSKNKDHQKLMHSQCLTQSVPGAELVIAHASISDRVADQKAVVTAFLSEKMLSFSLAHGLLDLTKFLAKDKSALSRLQFSRTSATYINTHGTAK